MRFNSIHSDLSFVSQGQPLSVVAQKVFDVVLPMGITCKLCTTVTVTVRKFSISCCHWAPCTNYVLLLQLLYGSIRYYVSNGRYVQITYFCCSYCTEVFDVVLPMGATRKLRTSVAVTVRKYSMSCFQWVLRANCVLLLQLLYGSIRYRVAHERCEQITYYCYSFCTEVFDIVLPKSAANKLRTAVTVTVGNRHFALQK